MIRMPNLQMDRNLTIRVKIWLFFMMFVCIVFILMWILQVVFLERFYEAFKITDIAKSAKILTQSCQQENFSTLAEELAMRNEMCISILNTDGPGNLSALCFRTEVFAAQQSGCLFLSDGFKTQ